MANYCGFSRTNYFRVTDEERYKWLFKGLFCGEDSVQDFTKTDDNGVVWHGFGAYDSIEYLTCSYEDDDGNVKTVRYADRGEDDDDLCDWQDDFDEFVTELRKILPEDEAFILTEVGYEKLRYLTGWTIVATKNNPTEYINLRDKAVDAARKLLGDDKWSTVMEY